MIVPFKKICVCGSDSFHIIYDVNLVGQYIPLILECVQCKQKYTIQFEQHIKIEEESMDKYVVVTLRGEEERPKSKQRQLE